ncbi:MAG: FAD-dependent oxidoreductase [Candidatus Omnitrophota bacterium]
MTRKVIIIGCGFAGFFAAKKLAFYRKKIELTVIDKKKTSDFLPLLPDVIGRDINPCYLRYSTDNLSKKYKFKFINDEVKALDLDKNEIFLASGSFNYDYLLIASGSETNFYNNDFIKKYAYKLDDTNDTVVLLQTIRNKNFNNVIISGGGYTGIELASNLRRFLKSRNIDKRIILVERGPFILGSLPSWMAKYCGNNLKNLSIEILTNTTIKRIDDDNVLLSNGARLDKTMLIWTAGVKTSDFIQNINVQKNHQGRLIVDDYLRLRDNCFVAGDAACVKQGNSFLRMAVQFTIYQASSAADNILRSIDKRRLKPYRPLDLGYIIPMANNKSCGIILGVNVRGRFATLIHFIMCWYRSFGLRNKFGLISCLMKGGW